MKLVLARAYDWEGLYFDGVCATQGHSISLHEALTMIKDKGEPIEEIEFKDIDEDWLQWEGLLPTKIEEVRWKQ